MSAPCPDPLVNLIVKLMVMVGDLIRTSIVHKQRFREMYEQLSAMKAAIEQGRVQTEAKLAEILATVQSFKSEMLELIAQEGQQRREDWEREMQKQREDREEERHHLVAWVKQEVNRSIRPLYYVVAGLAVGVIGLAGEVFYLASEIGRHAH